MPPTARDLGVRDRSDPLESIRAGARYWSWQRHMWRGHDRTAEQIRPLAIGGWNWGRKHMLDVQAREGCLQWHGCFVRLVPEETRDLAWRVEHLVSTGRWQPKPPPHWAGGTH